VKQTYPQILALVFISCVLILTTISCSPLTDNKIPITTSSDEARELYLKGRGLSDKLQNQESIEYFTKAIENDPEFAVAYLNLAFVSPSFKGFFENVDKAKNLISKVSDGEKLWIDGVIAGNNGLPLKQRELYKQLVEKYPNDERAHNLLAGNYFAQQDYDSSIVEYTKATEIAPQFSQPYNQLGYAHRFQGQYDAAEKAFLKYIELIPDSPNPYDSYAELLMKRGKYAESIKHYEIALTKNPLFFASFIGIATNLNYLGNHEEARLKLQEFYSLSRNDGEKRASLFAKAISFVDEGDFQSSIYVQKKQYLLAERILDFAAMAADLNVIGNILLEMGEFDQALENYKNALKLVEGSQLSEEVKDNARRTWLNNSARIDISKGDNEAAKGRLEEFTKQVKTMNNPFQIKLSHELAGLIAFAEHNYSMAVDEFNQSNLQDPYNLYRLSLTYRALGENVKADEYAEKALNFNALNNLNQSIVRFKLMQTTEILPD
jgi:tetratricopeptide (TPR) repeat protein